MEYFQVHVCPELFHCGNCTSTQCYFAHPKFNRGIEILNVCMKGWLGVCSDKKCKLYHKSDDLRNKPLEENDPVINNKNRKIRRLTRKNCDLKVENQELRKDYNVLMDKHRQLLKEASRQDSYINHLKDRVRGNYKYNRQGERYTKKRKI